MAGTHEMSAVVVTGSAGLIGSEAAQFYCQRGHLVIGIDNDMRSAFFGSDASTRWKRDALVREFAVLGYKGKQVRNNIHSHNYVEAIDRFYRAPRVGEVYNIGGGRFCSCSVLEAIALCEEIAGKRLQWQYADTPRIGDHIWWITSTRKFTEHFPSWAQQYDLRATLEQMLEQHVARSA